MSGRPKEDAAVEDYEHKEWGYVVGFLIGVSICWHTPFWVAEAIGYLDKLEAWVAIADSWENPLTLLSHLILVIVGAAINAAAFFILFLIGYGLWRVSVAIGKWLLYQLEILLTALITIAQWLVNGVISIVTTITRAIWDFLTWPLRFIFEVIGDLYAAFAQSTNRRRHERVQLKQAYNEKYRQDFRSFRAFMKYWKALQRGENPPYPGSEGNGNGSGGNNGRRQKENNNPGGSGAPGGNGSDPYQFALNVIGLTEPFTKAELNARYKRAIARCHPDKTGGDDREAKRVNMARDVILKRKGWS
ncbi:MAG: hypothetical protein CMN84_11365 [Spongiibacteraceae bacterium]|nr:hypothetical protein [Spongiibacteraceae bacterium]